MEWHGYTTNLQIEQVTSWIEVQARLHPCTCLINDCSKIISVWEDSVQWFSRSWMAKMKYIGVNNFVHVAKPGTFGDKIGKQIGVILTNQVQFYACADRMQALEWLEVNSSSVFSDPNQAS